MKPVLLDEPRLSRDWKLLGLMVLAAFAVGAGMRFMDFSSWNVDPLKVDGEFIMATHDAYHWLAGAKGVGAGAGQFMAQLARFLSAATGLSLGLVGFWAPMVAGGLLAAVVTLWAWALGGLEAGLLAGALAALSPGFYMRTRLGYYDTDIVSLLLPVLAALFMCLCLRPYLDTRRPLRLAQEWLSRRRKGKGKAVAQPEADASSDPGAAPGALTFALLTLSGYATRLFAQCYGHIGVYGSVLYALGIFIVLVWGRRGQRPPLFFGLLCFGIAFYLSWLGLGVGLAICVLYRKRPDLYAPAFERPWALLLCLVLLFVFCGVPGQVWDFLTNSVAPYLKPVAQKVRGTQQTVAYPGIAQSVIEAQNIPVDIMITQIHPWQALAVSGLAAYAVACLFRPLALLLLPLAVLGLGAFKLGGRTVMFVGPEFSLGMALACVAGARLLLGASVRRRLLSVGLGVALTVVVLLPYLEAYPTLPPTPIMSKAHCLALKHLGKVAPKGSGVWTWWDWGYATHYFAERKSFGDGANHAGEVLFPLGNVFVTPSPMQSAQMIKFGAQENLEPWKAWNKMTPEKARDFVVRTSYQDMDLKPGHKQYIVVPFENFRLMYWVSFYGSWDFLQRKGTGYSISEVTEEFTLDAKNGVAQLHNSGRVPLRSIDVLDRRGRQHVDYPNNNTVHMVINNVTGIHFLMDDVIYRSMMSRLFMDNPKTSDLAAHFKLVYEGFPEVRIYEVL